MPIATHQGCPFLRCHGEAHFKCRFNLYVHRYQNILFKNEHADKAVVHTKLWVNNSGGMLKQAGVCRGVVSRVCCRMQMFMQAPSFQVLAVILVVLAKSHEYFLCRARHFANTAAHAYDVGCEDNNMVVFFRQ